VKFAKFLSGLHCIVNGPLVEIAQPSPTAQDRQVKSGQEKDMVKVSRGSAFWVLLIVAAFLPATLLANKQMYHANISSGGFGVGSSVITVTSSGYNYMAKTRSRPDGIITEVRLTPTSGAWSIVLCTNENEFVEDDCTYDDTGNLDIEGAVTPSHLITAGVTGRQFNDALRNGQLTIVLSDGSAGTYVRII
jgi:hypothetical protein